MCNINDFGINYLCQSLPFGGVKISGFGRFAGIEGLRAECFVKAVTQDRLSWIKTHIPPLLDYPMQPQANVFCESLAYFVYGQNMLDRLKGIFGLITANLKPSLSKKDICVNKEE